VIVELESIGWWFLAMLPEEAEEQSEGVGDVLIEVRLKKLHLKSCLVRRPSTSGGYSGAGC
jgi:hypothetical protein